MTDEGYRAARCTCGHSVAEHKSSRSGGLHASRYGICLAEGCDCREFSDVEAQIDALSRAATDDNP
jgi:hypothetical protein